MSRPPPTCWSRRRRLSTTGGRANTRRGSAPARSSSGLCADARRRRSNVLWRVIAARARGEGWDAGLVATFRNFARGERGAASHRWLARERSRAACRRSRLHGRNSIRRAMTLCVASPPKAGPDGRDVGRIEPPPRAIPYIIARQVITPAAYARPAPATPAAFLRRAAPRLRPCGRSCRRQGGG